MVSNFVKAQDSTIFHESGGKRALEVKRIGESLAARKKYSRASVFMQMELNLVQGPAMQASVGAALGLCNVMQQTQNPVLLFRAAKLRGQLSSILSNIIPQLGEQIARQSTAIFEQMFPRMEVQCPAVSFDVAISLISGSSSAEGEKSRQLLHLSDSAQEWGDFTRANQALVAARDEAQKHWHQCKTLPSGPTALQDLNDFHTRYIDLHRNDTGMAFFESVGVNDHMSTLYIHHKDNQGVLETFEAFQNRHNDFALPTHQEHRFDQAMKAAKGLAMKEQSQAYSTQYFNWFKKCPFTDRWGSLAESTLSDPDHYLRQIFVGAEDPIEWGNNALALILGLAKIEFRRGLLTTGALRELFGFALETGTDEEPDFFLECFNYLDFEEAAERFYGDLSHLTPSTTFLDNMQRLKDWLSIPERPPSRVARLNTAKIIMQSRLHRVRMYMISKGLPEDVDISDYSKEQLVLDDIERLEVDAGPGWSDQPDRQIASRIQTFLNKCYVHEAVTKGLISEGELQSRISDCVDLASKYANGRRSFLEYHTLLQQSRLYWQQYLHFGSVPPDAGLEVLEKANLLFTKTRKRILLPDPADSFTAAISLTEEFRSQEHSKMALAATFQSFLNKMAAAQEAYPSGPSDTPLGDIALESYERFLKWAYGSKGRVLTELLIRGRLQKILNESNNAEDEISQPSSVQAERTREDETLQDELEHKKIPGSEIALSKLSNKVVDETMVSEAQINDMLNKVGRNVVIVDIVNIPYLGQGGSQAILYRDGSLSIMPIPLPDLTVKAVANWVEMHLSSPKRPIDEQLGGHASAGALKELTPLLLPLFDRDLVQSIKSKEILIFCLTGALHGIPIHAIPIDGVPIIEDHPVVYCESLTSLHHSFEAVAESQPLHSNPASLAIIPSYEKPWTKDPKAEAPLLRKVERTTTSLNGKVCSGSSLTKENIQDSLSNRAHVHYYGHVHYNPKSPLRSALLLNERARTDPDLLTPGSEGLAIRDLFKPALQKPALVTLIGCGSGQSFISSSDDILGLPSAFLFAGASAVVSTLWPIAADDGADFAETFYEIFQRRQQHGMDSAEDKNVGSPDVDADVSRSSGLQRCINLAYVMQEAVKTMRERAKGKEAAYHWAGFSLTGFWLFPPMAMRD